MNARIKLLGRQTMSDVMNGSDPYGDADKMYIPAEFMEKFAQLIIKECANVVLEPHNESNFIISMSKCKFSTRQAIDRAAQTGGLKCDTESVSTQILKHFGVEE